MRKKRRVCQICGEKLVKTKITTLGWSWSEERTELRERCPNGCVQFPNSKKNKISEKQVEWWTF